MSTTTSWIEQSVHTPKRKRAGLVCVLCHERKIKCDLQAQDESGYKRCSRCIANRRECRLRESKRGNHHSRAAPRSDSPQSLEAPSPLQVTHMPSPPHVTQTTSPLHVTRLQSSQLHPVNEMDDVLRTPSQSTATNDCMSIHYSQPQTGVPPRSTEPYPSFSHRSNYLYAQLPVNRMEPPMAPQSDVPIGSSTDQSWSVPSPQSSRNKNSEVYLGESGFLTVYSQEHRDYANGQEAGPKGDELTQDLPGPDLMQIFTETYFNSCYSFCPVLDRETLASDLARSPLLVNALALTGSQIQPPIIPSTKPEAYYSRAKHMFYDGEEIDPITCLQAISLFYWWSPRPSIRMQRDGAWWWSAAGIRQAQQMGFHREPRPGHPNSSSIDRGLRRRIWWTFFVSN
jgi:hypothetical protein